MPRPYRFVISLDVDHVALYDNGVGFVLMSGDKYVLIKIDSVPGPQFQERWQKAMGQLEHMRRLEAEAGTGAEEPGYDIQVLGDQQIGQPRLGLVAGLPHFMGAAVELAGLTRNLKHIYCWQWCWDLDMILKLRLTSAALREFIGCFEVQAKLWK